MLVTGSSGKIGKIICQSLPAIPVSSRECNLLQNDLTDWFRLHYPGKHVDTVFHLARTRTSPMWSSYVKEEIAILHNVLRFMQEVKIKQLVYFSSWVVTAEGFEDNYTKSKRLCERIIIEYPDRKWTYVIIRPSLVLGQGMEWMPGTPLASLYTIFDSQDKHAIWVHDLAKLAEEVTTEDKIINAWGNTMPISNNNGTIIVVIAVFILAFLVVFPLITVITVLILTVIILVIYNISTFRALQQTMDNPGPQKFTLSDHILGIENKRYSPKSREDLKDFLNVIKKYNLQVRAYGKEQSQYFSLLPFPGVRIIMNNFNNIVLEDDTVTAEAGVCLTDLITLLEKNNKTLLTVPEFTDVSIGAVIATQVHGSNKEYKMLSETITQTEKIDNIIIAATFRIADLKYLRRSIHVYDHAQDNVLDIVKYYHADPDVISMTAHYYRTKNRLMVWAFYPAVTSSKVDKPFMIRRYHPYMTNLLRNTPDVILPFGSGLGSWPKLSPIEKQFIYRADHCEIHVPWNQLNEIWFCLNKSPQIGIRFGGPTGLWIEPFTISAKDLQLPLIEYHKGKYTPK